MKMIVFSRLYLKSRNYVLSVKKKKEIIKAECNGHLVSERSLEGIVSSNFLVT